MPKSPNDPSQQASGGKAITFVEMGQKKSAAAKFLAECIGKPGKDAEGEK